MILITDGDYNEQAFCGFMAGVLMEDFDSEEISGFVTAEISEIGAYESGAFYKRELSGVKSLLSKLNLSQIQCVVVDGYAVFGDGEHISLGERVFAEYGIPVIGIAKSRNLFCKIEDTEVFRGKSQTPLFVTAIGMELAYAKEKVKSMFGEHRIPYGVKIADSLARKHRVILN